MPTMREGNKWLVNNALDAASSGKSTHHATIMNFANPAERGKSRRSQTAFLGMVGSHQISSHPLTN